MDDKLYLTIQVYSFNNTNMELILNYASFWKRFAAAVIDSIIVYILVAILQPLIMKPLAMNSGFMLGNIGAFLAFAILVSIVAVLAYWIYHAAFESSSKQATPGKMALGIKVTDLNGGRIGFGKATGRYFGKILSMVILYIGFIMVAFTEKKQGLHDKMADCLVVNK